MTIATAAKPIIPIIRNGYGEIIQGEVLTVAQSLLAMAAGKITASFDDMSWGTRGKERHHRIGEAVHHEIYDVNPAGTRTLVCVRAVEGTRYGVKTCSKDYFVVARHGRGVRVLPANKAVAAKAAKAAGDSLGLAIDAALAKPKRSAKHGSSAA